MKKVPYIEQMNKTECGLSCVLSVLRFYGSREMLADLREEMEFGRDGYSFAALRSLFESRKVQVKTCSAKSIADLKQFGVPVILYWDSRHFVVAYRITKKYVYIMDPASGYVRMDLSEADSHFSNAAMIAFPEKDYKKRKSSFPSPWKIVFEVMHVSRISMVLSFIFAVADYFIIISIPDKTSEIIDNAISYASFSSVLPAVKALAMIGLTFLALSFIRNLNIMICNIIFTKTIERKTFRHLLRLPYKYFEMRQSGDILFRMSSLSEFRDLFTTQIVSGIVDAGTIVFIFGFILKKSVFLAVCALILSFVNLLILIIGKNPLEENYKQQVSEQNKLQTLENEAVVTFASVKTSGMEDSIFDGWNSRLMSYIDKFRKQTIISNIYQTFSGGFVMFAPAVIMIMGLFKYFQGELSIGEAVAVQTLSSTLFASESSVFGCYTQFLLSSSYLNRVNDIWNEAEDPSFSRTGEYEMKGGIEINDLSFSYSRDSHKVLSNISLKAEPGQRLAFVGRSGSGKSSLGKIISGLYEIGDGMVKFDGNDMNSFNRKTICRNIGVVPQDVYLLSRSIYDNIVMNNKDITKAEVEEACRAVNIYDEIMQMPMGFETIVSDMGMNLSGGQRQRLAIARALVHHPKIVVMDEATSALDSVNERMITEHLKKEGCTQIIIAHRLSTVIDADRIYVMENGEITESGTHDELMKNKGAYYELYLNSEI